MKVATFEREDGKLTVYEGLVKVRLFVDSDTDAVANPVSCVEIGLDPLYNNHNNAGAVRTIFGDPESLIFFSGLALRGSGLEGPELLHLSEAMYKQCGWNAEVSVESVVPDNVAERYDRWINRQLQNILKSTVNNDPRDSAIGSLALKTPDVFPEDWLRP